MQNYYFDYMMYMAFESLLMYDERRTLTIKQLYNYSEFLTDGIKKWIKNDNKQQGNDNRLEITKISYDLAKKDFLTKNGNISVDDGNDLLNIFLKNNTNYFERKDDEIYVKKHVKADDLMQKTLYEYSNKYKQYFVIFSIMNLFLHNPKALDILNANSYKNELTEIIKSESIMENLFLNYDKSVKKFIRDINILNNHRLSKYFNKSSFECSALNNILQELDKDKNSGECFCSNIFSNSLKENDLFYNINHLSEIHFDDTDIKLGLWFSSLFSDKKLYLSKISHQIMDMIMYKQKIEFDNNENTFDSDEDIDELEEFDEYLDEELEEDENNVYKDEFDDDEVYTYCNYDEKEEFMSLEKHEKSAFINNNAALKYIKEINDYEKKYGFNEELTKVKRRILYILNIYGYELYEDSKLPKIVENISLDIDNNKRDYMDYYIHARLFLFDIIVYNTFDELTLNRILFVSTYYDLTHDIRIKRIIDKYKDTDIGNKVYRAIINHESNLFLYEIKNNKLIKK